MKNLTSNDFSDVTGKGNTVVDFWAPWCGPCKVFAPRFESVAQRQTGITFAKLNTEDEPEVAQKQGIRAIPTLIFYRDGKAIERFSGAMDEAQFEKKVKDVFGASAPSPIDPDEDDDDDSDDDEDDEDDEMEMAA